MGRLIGLVAVLAAVSGVILSYSRNPCEEGYLHNPFANTCVRPVAEKMSRDDAKDNCVASGERLVELRTVNDLHWFNMMRHTVWQEVKFFSAWIGGKLHSDKFWYWEGGNTVAGDADIIYTCNWEEKQPDEPDTAECMSSSTWTKPFKWRDVPCSVELNSFCEKDVGRKGPSASVQGLLCRFGRC